jgi:hypothetical protein
MASSLAISADAIADTLSRAALVHDAVALNTRHPLHEQSTRHAALDRQLAVEERIAAAHFRAIASGLDA